MPAAAYLHVLGAPSAGLPVVFAVIAVGQCHNTRLPPEPDMHLPFPRALAGCSWNPLFDQALTETGLPSLKRDRSACKPWKDTTQRVEGRTRKSDQARRVGDVLSRHERLAMQGRRAWPPINPNRPLDDGACCSTVPAQRAALASLYVCRCNDKGACMQKHHGGHC